MREPEDKRKLKKEESGDTSESSSPRSSEKDERAAAVKPYKQIVKSKEYKRSSLLHLVVGFVIGIGGILPGVSGGVMAVSLGLYKPIIDALAGFFKAPIRNTLFLAPIGIGAALGLLLGSIALDGVMDSYYTQVMFLFLGLVAGGIPSFLKEANQRGFKPRYLIATVCGALIASTLLLLDKEASGSAEAGSLMPLEALISGAILSIGTVIPGISTSFILMYLGWYKPAMAAVANFELVTLAFMGIGAVGFALLTIKAARWFFDRFYSYAYYGVLGFLIISAILIFPGFSGGWMTVLDIGLAAAGLAGAYAFGRIGA